MKLKQLMITAWLFLVPYLAYSATYDLLGEHSSPTAGEPIVPGDILSDDFGGLHEMVQQNNMTQQKQDYAEALSLLKDRKLATAEAKIDQLINQSPNEALYYNLRATLEAYRKQYKRAIKTYQHVTELDPNNLISQLGMAIIFLQQGDFSQVTAHANKALSINDSLVSAYFLLAEVANKEHKPQDIEPLLLTAQKKVSGQGLPELMVDNKLINFYFSQKQPEKALELAQAALKKYPGNSAALELLGTVQVFNRQPAQAIVTLKKLIGQESGDFRNRLLLAKLLVLQPGNKQQIVKLLDEAGHLAPNNVRAQLQKAVILTQLKFFPEALLIAKKIRQLAPKTGLAEALEGSIYQDEKKLDLSLAAFQKSYLIKPNNKMLKAISDNMLAQKRATDAITFLNKESTTPAHKIAANFLLGNIYLLQKDEAKAEVNYQTVLAEQPDNIIALNNLAWIYSQQNNPKALALAEKAYKKAPQSADITDTYAGILIKQGHLSKGLAMFKQANTLAPNNNEIQYHLAHAYSLNGQPKSAIKILKLITQSEKNFPDKNEAFKLLKKLRVQGVSQLD